MLCPELAKPQPDIITIDNIKSLVLSTYERTPGTSVTITCLSNTSHKLVGESVLTCLQNGTWSADVPTCEYVKPTTIAPTTTPGEWVPARSININYFPW